MYNKRETCWSCSTFQILIFLGPLNLTIQSHIQNITIQADWKLKSSWVTLLLVVSEELCRDKSFTVSRGGVFWPIKKIAYGGDNVWAMDIDRRDICSDLC